jgi:hypothetical protein
MPPNDSLKPIFQLQRSIHSPHLVILPFAYILVKTEIFPILRCPHQPMPHRIVMDVLYMPTPIPLISNTVLRTKTIASAEQHSEPYTKMIADAASPAQKIGAA